jgi:hypothetical protein
MALQALPFHIQLFSVTFGVLPSLFSILRLVQKLAGEEKLTGCRMKNLPQQKNGAQMTHSQTV